MWNDSGFTVIDDRELFLVPDAKIAELFERTVDKNAIKCIVPFIGTQEINSLCWQSLKKQLETNNIKFLISTQEKQDKMDEEGDVFVLSSDQYAKELLPYGQTDMLINECVNLSAEFKNGLVKLKEPRYGYKDRAVVLAYANYFAEKLDTKYMQSYQTEDIDYDSIQLVW